jgi:hypothetical protein
LSRFLSSNSCSSLRESCDSERADHAVQLTAESGV